MFIFLAFILGLGGSGEAAALFIFLHWATND